MKVGKMGPSERKQVVLVGEMSLLRAGRERRRENLVQVKERQRGTRLEMWKEVEMAMGQLSILLSSSVGGKKALSNPSRKREEK